MDKEKSEFELYIDNLLLNAAELERSGALFLMIGYSQFLKGADLDIIELTCKEDTILTRDEVVITGQSFVLIGYLFLYIVSYKRLCTLNLENLESEVKTPTAPLECLVFAYRLSVIANALRLTAFNQIRDIDYYEHNKTEELD
ncbi:MAG: hypothetical protein ACRC7N_12460 [Clostridium sp.]